MVIQLARLGAVQVQRLGAVTLTLKRPPPELACWLVGSIANVQPAWATLSVRPATAIVPLRGLAAPLGATVYVIVALPAPVPVAVTVIQSAWLAASQPQSPAVVMVRLPSPPSASKESLAGAVEYTHGGGGGDVVMRCTVPPRPTT